MNRQYYKPKYSAIQSKNLTHISDPPSSQSHINNKQYVQASPPYRHAPYPHKHYDKNIDKMTEDDYLKSLQCSSVHGNNQSVSYEMSWIYGLVNNIERVSSSQSASSKKNKEQNELKRRIGGINSNSSHNYMDKKEAVAQIDEKIRRYDGESYSMKKQKYKIQNTDAGDRYSKTKQFQSNVSSKYSTVACSQIQEAHSGNRGRYTIQQHQIQKMKDRTSLQRENINLQKYNSLYPQEHQECFSKQGPRKKYNYDFENENMGQKESSFEKKYNNYQSTAGRIKRRNVDENSFSKKDWNAGQGAESKKKYRQSYEYPEKYDKCKYQPSKQQAGEQKLKKPYESMLKHIQESSEKVYSNLGYNRKYFPKEEPEDVQNEAKMQEMTSKLNKVLDNIHKKSKSLQKDWKIIHSRSQYQIEKKQQSRQPESLDKRNRSVSEKPSLPQKYAQKAPIYEYPEGKVKRQSLLQKYGQLQRNLDKREEYKKIDSSDKKDRARNMEYDATEFQSKSKTYEQELSKKYGNYLQIPKSVYSYENNGTKNLSTNHVRRNSSTRNKQQKREKQIEKMKKSLGKHLPKEIIIEESSSEFGSSQFSEEPRCSSSKTSLKLRIHEEEQTNEKRNMELEFGKIFRILDKERIGHINNKNCDFSQINQQLRYLLGGVVTKIRYSSEEVPEEKFKEQCFKIWVQLSNTERKEVCKLIQSNYEKYIQSQSQNRSKHYDSSDFRINFKKVKEEEQNKNKFNIREAENSHTVPSLSIKQQLAESEIYENKSGRSSKKSSEFSQVVKKYEFNLDQDFTPRENQTQVVWEKLSAQNNAINKSSEKKGIYENMNSKGEGVHRRNFSELYENLNSKLNKYLTTVASKDISGSNAYQSQLTYEKNNLGVEKENFNSLQLKKEYRSSTRAEQIAQQQSSKYVPKIPLQFEQLSKHYWETRRN